MCTSRLFAKNSNDLNIYLFAQTVCYSISPFPNVSFDPLCSEEPYQLHVVTHFLLHIWHFIIVPKRLRLDFNISTVKWILWFKAVPGKIQQCASSTTPTLVQ